MALVKPSFEASFNLFSVCGAGRSARLGGGGGGAFAPWSAVALLVIGVAGFAGRRRTVRQAKGSCKAR